MGVDWARAVPERAVVARGAAMKCRRFIWDMVTQLGWEWQTCAAGLVYARPQGVVRVGAEKNYDSVRRSEARSFRRRLARPG